jgi:hypothetical protein
MTCDDCGAACQGTRCRQCEVERQYAHLTDDSGSRWDRDEEVSEDE